MIKASINVSGALKVAKTATKQIRYAAAQALTEAATDYVKVGTVLMRQTLDRPIPFTQRGLKHRGATSANLTASVFMLPKQASYMIYQVEGGATSGKKPYPFKGAENAYGNLPNKPQATEHPKAITLLAKKGPSAGQYLTFIRSRSAKMPKRGWSGSYADKRMRRWKGLRLIAGSTSVRHYKPLYPFYERAHTRVPVIVRREFGKLLRSALAGARW